MGMISLRIYKDHEVRAIWSDDSQEWFFAVVDIIAAITESESPRKYWSVLKLRLKRQGNELATICSQLKLTAADGKKYNTDAFLTLFRRGNGIRGYISIADLQKRKNNGKQDT